MSKKTLHIVAGPTASGKTSFAIELAKDLQTEIVSADSRQIFKEMNIGVARPSFEELKSVKHHLIATWSIKEKYNVARYEKEALEVINSLFERYENLVLVGGSGLYIDAIIKGIDYMPDISERTKNSLQQLYENGGITALQKELKKSDPEYYDIVDKQNPRRLQRALEVCLESNKPFSYYRKENKKQRDFEVNFLAIRRKREDLINRINQRVDFMMEEGLLHEVEALRKYSDLIALNTVGYKEIFEYLDNKTTLSQAVELIKIHTRQYAKRQMTWFNKKENIHWLDM